MRHTIMMLIVGVVIVRLFIMARTGKATIGVWYSLELDRSERPILFWLHFFLIAFCVLVVAVLEFCPVR